MSEQPSIYNIQPTTQAERDRILELIEQRLNPIITAETVTRNNSLFVLGIPRLNANDRHLINQWFERVFRADSAEGTEPGGN